MPRLLALAGAVLLAHALVLDGLQQAGEPTAAPQRRGPAPVAVVTWVQAAATATPPAAAPQTRPTPLPAAPPAIQPAVAATRADGPDPPEATPTPPSPFSVAEPPSEAPTDPGAPAPAADTAPPPVYATRPAPAARRHYVQQRDGEPARAAVLDWQPSPDGSAWRLQLDTGPGAGWASQGALDAAGLAPSRLVEQRRGRERRAVNFQREQGVVSFSGPALQHPLHPGAQDRLSWLLQLGAVLNADPARAAPGTVLRLWVAGPGGHGELWPFEVLAADGAAVHLHRAAQRPWDTDVDVWLDPADHHLPLRWQLRLRGNGRLLRFERAPDAPAAAPGP